MREAGYLDGIGDGENHGGGNDQNRHEDGDTFHSISAQDHKNDAKRKTDKEEVLKEILVELFHVSWVVATLFI